jgi:predicted nucleotidyltransferase
VRRESYSGVKVFRAPERGHVLTLVRDWATAQRSRHPEISKVGLFGSYARGDHGPGSDLDVLIVVTRSTEPHWFLRSAEFDASVLPVGAELFVYTEDECKRMGRSSPWFRHVLREVVWLS